MTFKLKIGKSAYPQTAAKEIPATLSHYTDLRGMMGIIDNAEIWASNVSFLNDREELLYGLKSAVKVVGDIVSKRTFPDWNKTLKTIITRFEDGQLPTTYAACFCRSHDSLELWRGYGGHEQGVAITFNMSKLVGVLKAQHAILYPVVYGKLSAGGQITEELANRLGELEQKARVMNAGLLPEEKRRTVERRLSELLPQFKHKGFEGEDEWRFIVQRGVKPDKVDFRVRSHVLVPYIKLSLGDKVDLPIRSICIGPGRDQELTKESVQLFLEAKGLGDLISVKNSFVPYRV